MINKIDENGFPIAWESGSYRILLNNVNGSRPDTATLIHKEVLKGREYWAKRGRLQTDYANKKIDGKIQQYAKVYSVEIDKAHRGKGLGTRLYKSLLENLPSDVIGIGSHTENQSNKKEIPKIYRKLSAETFNDGAFELIKTKKENIMKTNEYRILRSTRNAGQYEGSQTASLAKAKAIISTARPGRKLRWRQEGDDICAYASAEDMTDEDKAIARLRLVTSNE